jgi:CRP-like cAMP-binding protein
MQYRDPFIEICVEGAASVFRGISQSEKELLDKHHFTSFFRKGDVIISQGSKPKGLACLASGKAKVFMIGAGNREQIIRLLRPMNFLNYKSIHSESLFPFTVAAIEESSVVVFERNMLSKILKQNSELASRFVKVVTDDLILSDARIISLTQKHVRGRIAESILLLRNTYGTESDGKTLKASLTRDDIAHLSNMTTSNAIRTLSSFVDEKILSAEGRRIIILDLKALEEISESGQ